MMTAFWLPSHSVRCKVTTICHQSAADLLVPLTCTDLFWWDDVRVQNQIFSFRPAAAMEIALRTPKVAYHWYTVNLCTYT